MPARHEYRIGWICALPVELAAAQAILDIIHPPLPNYTGDRNAYLLGSVAGHNIVITCLPAGIYGTSSATATATQMRFSYQSIQCCLLVGIGGGAPSSEWDIRLGDVVVSEPTMRYGGVIQYDYGKAVNGGQFVSTGTMDKPPEVLLKALTRLKAQQMVHGSGIHAIYTTALENYPRLREKFLDPGERHDRLFVAGYSHTGSASHCDQCQPSMLQPRPCRPDHEPRVFYGLIASANKVVKDAKTRDQLAQDHGILCFEMEAAGLMNTFPCLVIRGVCDYSDSHKNKRWQGYAALVAAAYAKELMLFLPSHELDGQAHVIPATIASHASCPIPHTPSSVSPEATAKLIQKPLPDRHNFNGRTINTGTDQKGDNERAELRQPRRQNESRQGRVNIPPALIPRKDQMLLFETSVSIALFQKSWHPWPGDCPGVFSAMRAWLTASGSSNLILLPDIRPHSRVKDLAVAVVHFLRRWKEAQHPSGSDIPAYQIFWTFSSTDSESNEAVESLKSLLYSILQANPDLLDSIASIDSQIHFDEDALWQILPLVLRSITHAFVILESQDPSFIRRFLSVAEEVLNGSCVKLKFLVASNRMLPGLSDLLPDRTRLLPIPLPPPQSRNHLRQPRRGFSWNLLDPRF